MHIKTNIYHAHMHLCWQEPSSQNTLIFFMYTYVNEIQLSHFACTKLLHDCSFISTIITTLYKYNSNSIKKIANRFHYLWQIRTWLTSRLLNFEPRLKSLSFGRAEFSMMSFRVSLLILLALSRERFTRKRRYITNKRTKKHRNKTAPTMPTTSSHVTL